MLLGGSLLCGALMALTSCATWNRSDEVEISAIGREHTADLGVFRAQQARILSAEDSKGELDFGELGQLVVEGVELVGWPGSAWLRADFMWVNTYQRTRRPPLVQLSIIDAEGDDWRSETAELTTTFGIEYGRGSTHAGWLRVPTAGIELRPGWTWGIALLPRE